MVSWSGFVEKMGGAEWRVVVVAVIAVGISVVAGGCLGFGGGGSQSVSDVQVESSAEAGVTVAFNYSVTADTTAVFEAPNGTILTEQRLSSDNTQSTLTIGNIQPGEYELILRQGDNTVASRTKSFEGANPTLTAIQPQWSGNSLSSVELRIRNNGDLPTIVRTASISVRETVIEHAVSERIPANESTTVTVSPTTSEAITITEPGTVTGSVAIEATHETRTGSLQKTFQGANLTLTTVNGTWNASRLEHVNVSVQNTGDLPMSANVTIQRNGTVLASTEAKQIPAGWTKSFETTTTDAIYAAGFGGTTTYDVVATSSTARVNRTVTHEIPPADINLESLKPVWEKGQLTSVAFNATNAENVSINAQAQVAINGTTVTTTPLSLPEASTGRFTIQGGDADTALFTPSRRGPHTVTLTLTGGGTSDAITSETVFNGRITSISASFASSYDDDTASMNSVHFDVQNTGYVPIGYDSAEISIDGETRTGFLIYEHGLARGQSTSEYLSTDILVSSGIHDLTIRLKNNGKIVLVESTTVLTNG